MSSFSEQDTEEGKSPSHFQISISVTSKNDILAVSMILSKMQIGHQ